MSDSPRRIGVFSDIHANLHALDATIGALEEQGVERMYCCGDVVGYGAHPNECCERLREREIPCIAGNHDHAALMRTNIAFFNEVARAAVIWTKDELTPQNTDYLTNLPIEYKDGEFYFVHASPENPEEWNYILTMGEARDAFDHFDKRFCFIGHSHQPFVIEFNDGGIHCPSTPVIDTEPHKRYLINVGSVGQPRDRNPLACSVIVDLDTQRIEFHRVPYDMDGARKAILDRNLPPQLADRLAFGA